MTAHTNDLVVGSAAALAGTDEGEGSQWCLNSIPEAVASIAQGKMIIVLDDENRENEGDLVMAAQDMTPEAAGFIIRYTGGVLCVPAQGAILDRLQLPLMVERNTDSLKTAYTITVDSLATTTGISATDRAETIRRLADPNATPLHFNRPGHVFPLRAREGGVLQRRGHTEASVDLCRLAGKYPVACISELVLESGEVMRRDACFEFARQHGLVVVTVEQLVEYLQYESCESRLPHR